MTRNKTPKLAALYLQAQNWGFDVTTINRFRLRSTSYGYITYPSRLHGNYRYRQAAFDGQRPQRPKYRWQPHDNRPEPPYYGELSAGKQCSVTVANGEKAVWALAAAGIQSVSLFGEGNRIADLVAAINKLEQPPACVAVWPDNDRAGLDAARKWASFRDKLPCELRLYDIVALFKQHSLVCPKHADLRDFWLAIGQDKALIQQALSGFNVLLDICKPAGNGNKPHHRDILPTTSGQWYAEYQAMVLAEVDRRSPPINATHRTCPNPSHPDIHPSFRISEQGVPQCSSGKQYEERP